jgi:copper chaperone CopZ
MTCDHCTRAVTEELTRVPGVEHVAVDFVPGGVSQVSVEAATSLTQEQLATAVVEAGYDIAV